MNLTNRERAADLIREMILPDFIKFSDIVTNRIFPTFHTFGKDATQHGEKWFKKRTSHLDPLDEDQYEVASYYADEAMDRTIVFADTLVSMYFASVGIYCVGLYHLFEQHLQNLPLIICDLNGYKNEMNAKKVAKRWLKEFFNIDVDEFNSWKIIDEEIRNVSNTFKHAEGKSAKELRIKKPDLFIHPNMRENGGDNESQNNHRIRKPLFGEDLYLTEVDFTYYVSVIKDFWNELAGKFSASDK